jgi:hypothetical protein
METFKYSELTTREKVVTDRVLERINTSKRGYIKLNVEEYWVAKKFVVKGHIYYKLILNLDSKILVRL